MQKFAESLFNSVKEDKETALFNGKRGECPNSLGVN